MVTRTIPVRPPARQADCRANRRALRNALQRGFIVEKGCFISDLQAGTDFRAMFALASAQQYQAKNGPYWRLELRDASGSIEAKIWSPQSQNYPDLQAGSIVDIAGRVGTYKERIEIAVDSLRVLAEDERAALDLRDFMPASARNPAEMFEELKLLCSATFTHAPWGRFIKALLKDEEISRGLLSAPAAVSMHHAYAGGLMEHTLGVCKLAMSLADLYPALDRQALLAGALCHDLGKMRELSYGLNTDYSDQGRLIGHISIGVEMLEPFLRKSALEAELAEHLKHMMLSHHGQREFGSPCLPATLEAQLLHYADNIDAKVNQISAALEAVPEGATGWSSYVKGLDRMVYKAAQSPQAPKKPLAAPPKKAREEASNPVQALQCSLLLKE